MRIQNKIILIFSCSIAIILFCVYHYLNQNLTQRSFKRIQENLEKQLSLSRSYLNDVVKEFSSEKLDAIADKIGKDTKTRVTVIAVDGAVLGDSQLTSKEISSVENHLYRPEVQDALSEGLGQSRRFSTTIKTDMLYMAMPFGKEKTLGIIRLAIPLEKITLLSQNLKHILFISLIIAFIFAIILNVIISDFITKPIREIYLTAKAIAQGDFSRKSIVKTKDEIGDLARSINEMAEQIRLRIREIDLSRSRLEAVLLSMFEGVMVLDAEGKILLMNKTLKDFLSVPLDLQGRRPLEAIRNIEIHDIADRALQLKAGVESKEITVFLPQEKTLLIYAAPVVRDNSVDGAVLVFHDITELRRLEKVRRDFVANVSHELRTPLSSIKGYAETLLEGALDDKKNAKDFLKIIVEDSNRLTQLIEDLLSLSKIESGKIFFRKEPCSIQAIVKKLVIGFQKQVKEKKIEVKIDIPGDLPKVLADEASISQVFLNLVDNAIKYNKEGGTIIISAIKKSDFVQVDIADTGIGIPEEDVSRVFERFYRVDKARSRELGGTGLGLSIVKNIIQAHGGEVFVKSSLTQGSTFSVTLPQA